jgi:nucleoside-diphosphate-sugar epimerase
MRVLDPAARVVLRCPDATAATANMVCVESYDNVPADTFNGATCVINCVGISSGTASALKQVNADLPFRFAEAAKAAGVRQIIHVSSFSVYGYASTVDRSTATAPNSDYGQSKLQGDQRLLTLCDERFTVSILRLPLVYGGGARSKLERLLHWWMRLRVLPTPVGDLSRAMIGVELAAEVIAALSREPRPGIFLAADPQPFTYAAVYCASGGRLARLPMPGAITDLVQRIAPAIGARLFGDSRLADVDNLAVKYGLASRLSDDIAAMLAK